MHGLDQLVLVSALVGVALLLIMWAVHYEVRRLREQVADSLLEAVAGNEDLRLQIRACVAEPPTKTVITYKDEALKDLPPEMLALRAHAAPLMEFLDTCEHPHFSAIVTGQSVELVEGVRRVFSQKVHDEQIAESERQAAIRECDRQLLNLMDEIERGLIEWQNAEILRENGAPFGGRG